MVAEEQRGTMQKKKPCEGYGRFERKPGNENYKEAKTPYVRARTMRIDDDDEDDDDDELQKHKKISSIVSFQ